MYYICDMGMHNELIPYWNGYRSDYVYAQPYLVKRHQLFEEHLFTKLETITSKLIKIMSEQTNLQTQIGRIATDVRRIADDFAALVAKQAGGETIPVTDLQSMSASLSQAADILEQADPPPADTSSSAPSPDGTLSAS